MKIQLEEQVAKNLEELIYKLNSCNNIRLTSNGSIINFSIIDNMREVLSKDENVQSFKIKELDDEFFVSIVLCRDPSIVSIQFKLSDDKVEELINKDNLFKNIEIIPPFLPL